MPAGQRIDPYINSRFLVEIDGIQTIEFTEVIIPDAFVNVIEYRSGADLPGFRKLPGQICYSDITLKWGVTKNHELCDWWEMVRQGHTQAARKNMAIVLKDEQSNDVMRWTFSNCWPVRYHPSALVAEGNDAFINTMVITHEGMQLDWPMR